MPRMTSMSEMRFVAKTNVLLDRIMSASTFALAMRTPSGIELDRKLLAATVHAAASWRAMIILGERPPFLNTKFGHHQSPRANRGQPVSPSLFETHQFAWGRLGVFALHVPNV